MVRVTSDFVVQ
ncbi:unnamed protein product, partial [Rotaria magnacalcarata]